RSVVRRAEGTKAADLDVGVEDPSQVSRHRFATHHGGARVTAGDGGGPHAALVSRVKPTVVAPSGGETGAPTSRTIKIGVRVPRSTHPATAPRLIRPTPPDPWLVMTMRVACSDSAGSTIVGQ